MDFFSFEKDVMLSIINENELYKKNLLNQYISANVISRTFTGHGFYTVYKISDTQFSLGDINIELGDTTADLNDMKNGVGFVLFIRNGIISCLEGYAYDEPWPDKIYEYKLK